MKNFQLTTDPTLPPATSRYSGRVALALQGGVAAMDRAEAQDPTVATEVVNSKLGRDDSPETLGERTESDGIQGRGAANWCAIAEWAFDAMATELFTLAAFQSGRWLLHKVRAMRAKDERVLVSRGAAILIGAAHVMEFVDDTRGLSLEAAADTVMMRGAEPTELSYAGVEPWLISFLAQDLAYRHVVVVDSGGEPAGPITVELGEIEQVYLPPRRER